MNIKEMQPARDAYNFQLLIKNILTTPLIYSSEQEIIYRDKVRYNYATFIKRVAKLAGVLERLGVKPGDTVAVMDWDSHRYLEAFFAIPMMGAVLHTINVRLSLEQLSYTLCHAEDVVILVNVDFIPLLESIKEKLKTIKKIVLLSDEKKVPDTTLDLCGEYEELLAESSDDYYFPDFSENKVATIFYTTGTTGRPKGVFFTHRQILLHTYGIMAALCAYKSQANINSEDVYMPLTPMFHVHAWGVPFLMTLLGAKQVYPGRYEPETLLKLIIGEEVTFSHCVPTIMHMIVNSPAAKKIDLSGWKVIIGGSPLPKSLCREALELGINLFTGYGLSETCPLLTITRLKPYMLTWDLEDQIKIRCRTGLPVPNILLDIVDKFGKPVQRDGKSSGEIIVRGPWLTKGYLKDKEKSKKLWEGGWLHTGDIGFIDNNGYLQITDRIKDIIKIGGENISSFQLEEILNQHTAVNEAVVVGIPDKKWGEIPLALVLLKEKFIADTTNDEIYDFLLKSICNEGNFEYLAQCKIILVDSIAKTGVGKINKKWIRKNYQQIIGKKRQTVSQRRIL